MEAGAGTGKTATLVARILSWSLTLGWERHATPSPSGQLPPDDEVAAKILDRIVAITFTDRAAAEMAERVATGLITLHRGAEPIGLEKGLLALADPLIRQRAGSLLRRVDHLRVTTIHSFCRSILAGFPLEAGWHPGFQVDADGSQLRRIVEDLLREYTETDEENYPTELTTLRKGLTSLTYMERFLP
jgi:ATP-dependent helicase/nuclease subunit A